jgi:hypothetical protein
MHGDSTSPAACLVAGSRPTTSSPHLIKVKQRQSVCRCTEHGMIVLSYADILQRPTWLVCLLARVLWCAMGFRLPSSQLRGLASQLRLGKGVCMHQHQRHSEQRTCSSRSCLPLHSWHSSTSTAALAMCSMLLPAPRSLQANGRK